MKFVRTRRYLRDLAAMKAAPADVEALERAIATNPSAGAVIPGLQGLRKIRFALAGRGKCGGGRAIYFLRLTEDLVIMLFAYSKSDREDLSQEQRKAALKLLAELEDMATEDE
ncbi:type II toxin-antitoxin system RelE/ParE family toxin [Zavarzinia sp.]|uniref:type II toxin-antitoxin system RelE/ParE family toxin n=1 Tax=Zavarzinia sp. TaxID=2027920 RepID=UPI003568529A